ncbi:disulfide bond formation protein B [Propionivibrio limicola]|uniref:disulfide bond formation protein B n=1 Tax=Propionivibrio limicola TaxID=167645 RepID=UPI001290CA5F|nr:disulfide bond formation protein B [Propionivibrio limicola]
MNNVTTMFCHKGRCITLAMGVAALSLGLIAVGLAFFLNLDACHLCIFQRLAYFVIAGCFFLTFASWNKPALRYASLAASAAFCIWGLIVSAKQSWMQWFPDSGFTCSLAETGFTEKLIDWLGQIYPLFFMATGFCGSKDLVIGGLSLANWSFLILLTFLAGSASVCIASFSTSSNRTALTKTPFIA